MKAAIAFSRAPEHDLESKDQTIVDLRKELNEAKSKFFKIKNEKSELMEQMREEDENRKSERDQQKAKDRKQQKASGDCEKSAQAPPKESEKEAKRQPEARRNVAACCARLVWRIVKRRNRRMVHRSGLKLR